MAEAATKKVSPFTFAILTDAHLYDIHDHRFDGFLAKAVADVNAMNPRPDFVLYAGDIGQSGKDSELKKGNMSSAGLLSTSWPYPPVEVPYPNIKMNRVDPGNFEDGLGSHSVGISQEFDGLLNYREFAHLLQDNVRRGLKL